MTEVQAHETDTSVVRLTPVELEAGGNMALKVKVSCPAACDLWGKTVRIIAEDAAVAKEVQLATFDGTANETDEFVVKALTQPGEYTWTAVFPAQEKAGILHQESSASFTFVVKPHTLSLEVWDVPSVIALGAGFRVKVGVRCSAGCKLAGREIEVYDHEGARVAACTLGDVPSADTSALYWAEVELDAPDTERRYRWTARFPGADLEPRHDEASCTFAFGVAPASEHVVTVESIDGDTKTPIRGARVALVPLRYRGSTYGGSTDDLGVATLRVPKGEYRVHVVGDGKESGWPTIKVAEDVTVRTELLSLKRGWWED